MGDKIDLILEKIENIEKNVKELRREVDEIKQREERGRRTLLTLTDIIKAIQEKATTNEMRIKRLENNSTTFMNAAKETQKEVINTKTEVKKVRLRVSHLAKSVTDKFAEIEEESNELKSKIKEISEENRKLKERVEVLQRKVDGFYQAFDKILQKLEESMECPTDKEKVRASRKMLNQTFTRLKKL